MQYRHFIVTVTLILALVMASGCTGLLMGDLKAEIHDSSSITVPLPLSSVLSVLVSQNTTTPPGDQFSTGEKGHSPQVAEHGTFLQAPPGEWVLPRSGTASCNPVAGAKVTVTLIGTLNKTHIADCITQENGDFSFYVPPPMEKSELTHYTLNFEITAPEYSLPPGSSNVVTDIANVSDGPFYTFNVCYQQPSEPNTMAVTRGGIAVTGRMSS
jgi:hypothetical protein